MMPDYLKADERRLAVELDIRRKVAQDTLANASAGPMHPMARNTLTTTAPLVLLLQRLEAERKHSDEIAQIATAAKLERDFVGEVLSRGLSLIEAAERATDGTADGNDIDSLKRVIAEYRRTIQLFQQQE